MTGPWREVEEDGTDDNSVGFCALDFTTNYGVPIGWTTPSATGDEIEEPEE